MTQGKTTIAPEVLNTIARLTTLGIPGVSRISSPPTNLRRIIKRSYHDGIQIEIHDDKALIDIYVILEKNVNIREVSRSIQQQVARAISETVGLQIEYINVHIEDIVFPENSEA